MTTDRPFVGSDAVAAGLLTPARLRGPGYRTLFRGIALPSGLEVSYPLLCEAAYLTVRGTGVLAYYSAAEMLGAPCAPLHAPAEVLVPGGNRRRQRGLRVHRGQVRGDEVCHRVPVPLVDQRGRVRVDPTRVVDVTSPLRTAFDLARREPRIEAVVALDALAHRGGFDPALVLDVAACHPGLRGSAGLPDLVALADRLSESPMETRIRLALHDGGLPRPVLQHPVGRYRLDLAYPARLLAVEYDGAHHRTAEQARADLERQAYLTSVGWTILRPPARLVLRDPPAVADLVRRHLAVARAALPVPPA